VTADESKSTVFSSGKPVASMEQIPLGGHSLPISTAGESAK